MTSARMRSGERPVVLVLLGGPDAEREVSIESGRGVAAGLRSAGWTVVEELIDRPDAAALASMPGDVVFPVLHGSWGEGGGIQTELETAGRAYVGSRPAAAALAMDKLATKQLLPGVPTPQSQELGAADACIIEPPLVLKPVDDGSSIDLRLCHTTDEVAAARRELHPRRPRLMAERYVRGREVTVGILDGTALPIIEIVPGVAFYDYDAKYRRDDTGYLVDPDLAPGVADRCRAISLLAWERIGCRDLARADFIVDEDGPWFLEINTMPGFTSHSLLPKAAAAAGIDFAALCDRLVRGAVERAERSRAAAASPGRR